MSELDEMTPASPDPSPGPSAETLAIVCDWLAEQFVRQPTEDQVSALQTMQGQVMLRWIGTVVNSSAAAEAMIEQVAGVSAETVLRTLQQSFVSLFEPILRNRSIPPYASSWDGTGHLFGPAVTRMHGLLTQLDVHLDTSCCEPADHVSVQLSTLAESLRQDNAEVTRLVLRELDAWCGQFSAALIKADGSGYFGNAAWLLIALLDSEVLNRCRAGGSEAAVSATGL